jgi:hypothetical protein
MALFVACLQPQAPCSKRPLSWLTGPRVVSIGLFFNVAALGHGRQSQHVGRAAACRCSAALAVAAGLGLRRRTRRLRCVGLGITASPQLVSDRVRGVA